MPPAGAPLGFSKNSILSSSTSTTSSFPSAAASTSHKGSSQASHSSFSSGASAAASSSSLSSSKPSAAAASKSVSKESNDKMEVDDSMKAQIEARKLAVDEARKKKIEDENKAKLALVTQKNSEIEASKKEAQEAELRRKQAEAEITTVSGACDSLQSRYGIAFMEKTLSTICTILDNILKNAQEPKYRSINLKSETVQRAIARPLGGLALLRMCGFQSNEETNTYILPADANVSALQAVRQTLQTRLDAPVTDILSRLIAIEKSLGLECAFLAARELIKIISIIRNQPNLVTRRFDTISAFNSFIAPHSVITEVLFTTLKFRLDDKLNNKQAIREEMLSPNEIEYVANVERDLSKYLQSRSPHTPIAQSVSAVLTQNENKQLAFKFLNTFCIAMGKIDAQPGETKFQNIKLAAFFKIVGGDINQWQPLFSAFQFQLLQSPELMANITSSFEYTLFHARFVELGEHIEQAVAAHQQ